MEGEADKGTEMVFCPSGDLVSNRCKGLQILKFSSVFANLKNRF